MTKFQLAMLYFPDTPLEHSDSAVRHLMRWINQTRGLVEALEATGYRKYNQCFSSRQVRIIYDYIGEP